MINYTAVDVKAVIDCLKVSYEQVVAPGDFLLTTAPPSWQGHLAVTVASTKETGTYVVKMTGFRGALRHAYEWDWQSGWETQGGVAVKQKGPDCAFVSTSPTMTGAEDQDILSVLKGIYGKSVSIDGIAEDVQQEWMTEDDKSEEG